MIFYGIMRSDMRIQSPVVYSYEIERSRFIGYLFRCFSVEDAKFYLDEVRKEHPNATHVTHAYRIGESIAHSSDDSEPAGTAGMPMRDVLEKNHLTDIIAITVRYFGGIKLGAAGLTRAYAKSVSGAVALAVITEPVQVTKYRIETDYNLLGKAENVIRNRYTHESTEYGENAVITFLAKDDPTEVFREITSGRYIPEKIGTEEMEIPVKNPI